MGSPLQEAGQCGRSWPTYPHPNSGRPCTPLTLAFVNKSRERWACKEGKQQEEQAGSHHLRSQ